MNVLITGGGGMLAQALTRVLVQRGHSVQALTRGDLDITRRESVSDAITQAQPDVVFNGAAYTAVDRAEEDQDAAFAVNAEGPRNLAVACASLGALLVHPSTDYVFDGSLRRPLREDDPTGPASVYGASKLAGEEAIHAAGGRSLIARTSWLYGAGGKNFVDTMLGLGATRDRLTVVDDQTGSPTWTDDLAEALVDLAQAGETGVVHASNQGSTTWRAFAETALRLAGIETPVDPTTTEAFGAPAPRPRYSVLDLSGLETRLGRPMPSWQDALGRYLQSQNKLAARPTPHTLAEEPETP